MRQFETSYTLRDGAGKGALLVTEKFAFQETGRDGSTIQLHERSRAAGAEVMNSARNQFLACAGLSIDQHCGLSRSNSLDLMEDVAKDFAAAYDLFETLLGSDFVFEIQLLLRELVLQIGDLAISNRIFHRDCDLAGGLCKEGDILRREGILPSSEAHNAQNAVAVNKRQETAGFETLSQARGSCGIRRQIV